MRGPKQLVNLAAVAVVLGDAEGAWRREALPQAVLGELEYQALLVDPEGPLEVLHQVDGHDFSSFCAAAYRCDAGTARLVAGGDTKLLARWNGDTGAAIDMLSGHTGVVRCVTSMRLSQDHRVYLVSGDSAGELRIWRDSDATCVRVLHTHHRGIYGVSYLLTPDGSATRIVAGFGDGSVKLWQPDTGQPIAVAAMAAENQVMCVTTYRAPSGRWCIAAGSMDRVVWFWDAETGQELWPPRLTDFKHFVFCITSYTLPDGRVRIVTGGYDRTLRMWSGRTGIATGVVMRGHSNMVTAVAMSTLPNGQQCVVSGDVAGNLRVWDARTCAAVGTPVPAWFGSVYAIAAYTMPSGQHRIAATSLGGSILAWKRSSGTGVVRGAGGAPSNSRWRCCVS